MKHAYRALVPFAVALALVTTACSDSSKDVTGPGTTTATAIAGNNQEATPGGLLESYLIVYVTDASGHPAPGVQVTWTVTSGGGTLTQASSVTDAYGKALAAWQLGDQQGTQTVSARIAGVDQPIVFTAHTHNAL